MNKINRWLSALMCLCMLCSSLPGDLQAAFAEEALETVIEEIASTQNPVDEALYEEEELVLGGEAELPAESLSPVQANTEDVDSSVFAFGYAKILESAEMTDGFCSMNPALAVIPAGETVLVVDRIARDGTDQVRVAFNFEGTVVEVWLDASVIQPMTNDEVMAFQDAILEAVCYQDNVEYPLPEPQLVLPEVPTWPTQSPVDATVPAETNMPDVTEAPVHTVMPEETEAPEYTEAPEQTDVPETTEAPVQTVAPETTDEMEAESTEAPIVEEPVETSAPQVDTPQVMMMTSLFALDDQPGEITMQLAESAVELKVGESALIQPVFSDGGSYAVGYSLSASGIVSVDGASGAVTAVAPGAVTILVKCADLENVSAEYTVTVAEAEAPVVNESVAAAETIELTVGETLHVDDALSEGAVGAVEYVFSVDGVVEFDENGNLVAVGEGVCTVTALLAVPMTMDLDSEQVAQPAVLSTREITVQPAPVVAEEIQLNYTAYSVAASQEFALKYTLSDALSSETAAFSSADEAVAKVDPVSGVVQGIAAGETDIILTLSPSGRTAICRVTVTAAPDRIQITKVLKTIGRGQVTEPIEYKLFAGEEETAGKVTFKTSNKRVVQVNAKGQMRGERRGTATITVSFNNQVSASFKVTVKNAPKKLTLSPTSVDLAVGQDTKIKYTLTSNTAAGITYKSSNDSVASVDANGVVTANGAGTATIQVKTHNNLKKDFKVTVRKAPENVTLTAKMDMLGVGMTTTVVPAVDTTSDVRFAYEFWTEDTDLIRVDAATGGVEALAIGTARVYVKTYNGVADHATETGREPTYVQIKVVPKPDEVTVEGDKFNITVGRTIKLPVKFTMNDGSTECMATYSLKTSNKKVAAVNSAGQIKGMKAGTATVTMTASTGDVIEVSVIVRAKTRKVVLSDSKLTMGVGMEDALKARIYYSSSKYFTYNSADMEGVGKFVSSNPEVASVDPATGVIRGEMPGKATITFKPHYGTSASCTVTVMGIPTKITMSEKTLRLGEDMKATLKPVFEPYEMGKVEFSSSDESIVKVDSASGTVTAISRGEATITIDAGNGVTDTCAVTILPKPDEVTVEGDKFNITVGRTIKLPVKFTMNDGSTDCMATYSLKTSNKKVAAVNSAGQIKGMKAGTATVTMTASTGDVIEVSVIVRAKTRKVVLSDSKLTMGVGMEDALKARIYYSSSKYFTYNSADMEGVGKFVSSNPEVASVDPATGVIRGEMPGKATITFKPHYGTSASCTVTVMGEPASIAMNSSALTLGEMMDAKLSVKFNPFEFSSIAFASDNESVAKVSDNGTVTAVGAGYANITATALNGVTASCGVTVRHAPDKVALNVKSSNMAIGGKISLKATYSYQDTDDCMAELTYTSTNAKVATVSSAGVIKAVKAGSATIRVTAQNGEYADCKVVVRKKPTKVQFTSNRMDLGVDQLMDISAKVYFSGGNCVYSPSDSTYVRASIDDTRIARIDSATGKVVGMSVGTTTLRLKTYNGKTAQCKLVVHPPITWVDLSKSVLVMNPSESTRIYCSYTEGALGNITYTSSDPKVVSVYGSKDRTCEIAALSPGIAYITAMSDNGCSDTCQVVVNTVPDRIVFEQSNVIIRSTVGTYTEIPKVTVYSGQEVIQREVTYTIQGTAVSIPEPGYIKGEHVGTAVIIAKSGNVAATCTVTVERTGTSDELYLRAPRNQLDLNEYTWIECLEHVDGLLEEVENATFVSSDPSVVKVDSVTGRVDAVSGGTAVITATLADGRTGTMAFTVRGGKTRMLIAYYYGEPGDSGYLPFAYNNAAGMAQAFGAATVHDQQYDIAGPLSNVSKSTLFGTIESHFSDATEDDISLLYICSHGSARYGAEREYAFGLNGLGHVYASELMNLLERIPGKVVLFMDSCYSGGFIDCNKARLDALGGRISVLTSSHRSTSSCYWNVPQKLTAVDFFTHALLQGVGFNEANGIGGSRGWFRDYGGPADDDGNRNSEVTLSELFDYTKKVTVSNIGNMKGKKEFHGNPAQVPQCYLGANADLVIFSR